MTRFRDLPKHADAVTYIGLAIHNLATILMSTDIDAVTARDLIREAQDYYLANADETFDQ